MSPQYPELELDLEQSETRPEFSTMPSFNPPYWHQQDPAYTMMGRTEWQQQSSQMQGYSQHSQTQGYSQPGYTLSQPAGTSNVSSFWDTFGETVATATPLSQYGSYIPIEQYASTYQPPAYNPSSLSTYTGAPQTLTAAPTITPNVLSGSTPVAYPATRPVAIPLPQPAQQAYPIYQPQPGHSLGGGVSGVPMMSASSSSAELSVAVSGLPYDSELFFSSPSSATDDETLADTVDKLRARQLLRPPAANDPEAKDAYLLQAKRLGMSYREIKQRGGFREAESTLRGRYRTITKDKNERVRKPTWQAKDVSFLSLLSLLSSVQSPILTV
jgi:hypothetical protein